MSDSSERERSLRARDSGNILAGIWIGATFTSVVAGSLGKGLFGYSDDNAATLVVVGLAGATIYLYRRMRS